MKAKFENDPAFAETELEDFRKVYLQLLTEQLLLLLDLNKKEETDEETIRMYQDFSIWKKRS